MAKSKVKKVDDPATAEDESLQEVEETVDEVEHHDPEKTFALSDSGSLTYVDDEHPFWVRGWMRDRTILCNGVSYEHTHDDHDGVWVYKHLK